MRPLLNSIIFSFRYGHSVVAYVFFFVFSYLPSFLQ